MGGDVRLQSDPGQQSRLENWLEFQDYHLQNHERLEAKRDDRREALDVARKKAEGEDAAGVECEAEGPDFQYLLETAEKKLQSHENLLRWIEQERLAMAAAQAPSVEGDHDDQNSAIKAVRISAKSNCRKKRLKAHKVLGEVRKSKPEPRKRKTQRQKRKAPEAQAAIEDSRPPLLSSVSRNPDSRENKPLTTKKKTALSQIRPQRVSKDNRFADISAKPLAATSLRRVRPKRAPDRARSQQVTKSGRVSRRPKLFVPDMW